MQIKGFSRLASKSNYTVRAEIFVNKLTKHQHLSFHVTSWTVNGL